MKEQLPPASLVPPQPPLALLAPPALRILPVSSPLDFLLSGVDPRLLTRAVLVAGKWIVRGQPLLPPPQ